MLPDVDAVNSKSRTLINQKKINKSTRKKKQIIVNNDLEDFFLIYF